jgi:hypothetical protein
MVIANRSIFDNQVRLLEGCINRICVSNDTEEIKDMKYCAIIHLNRIYEYRKMHIETTVKKTEEESL